MSEPFEIQELVDASRAAAERAHINMDVANTALEAIRFAAAEDRNLFNLWDTINEQIGKADDPGLRQQLVQLRARFIEKLFSTEVARLEKAFEQSPDAGWNAWLTTLAEAITLFRFDFTTRLCEHPFPFPEPKKLALNGTTKAVRFMSQSRWPEAYDQFDYLATQDFLPEIIRARLLVILGQIQLFHFEKDARAKEFLIAAERLAPTDGEVLSGVGDYWMRQKDLDKATSYYKHAIEIAPRMASGYTRMGEYFESRNELDTAEEWYRKAIASASGNGSGYENLLKLYGWPELFKMHESDLQPLMERAITVSPEDEYQIYCDLGDIYTQNEQFDKAHRWYENAIALDPTRPGGYVALAQCYEKQTRNEKAEAAYKTAIEVAPECYDAYWGLTWLYEQQAKWQDALEWYERAPLHRKEWAGFMRAKAAEMQSRLQNYTEAETILKAELRADKDNATARDVLQTIADDYYQKHGDTSGATRVYGELLEILGDPYRGSYHNRLGNLNYFYGENAQAAKEYRRAIDAEPGVAVFHRNLALAYQQLKNYRQAEQELETAFGIDGDEKTYRKEMAFLLNAEGNNYFSQGNYREAVKRYKRAIDFDRSYDVIHVNLGDAWKQVREPGQRMEALDYAIQAFKHAQNINASEKYEKKIDTLQRKKEFASRYGEKTLDWLHVVTPIAVEVAGNLIRYTEGSTPGTLSDELSKHVTYMRERIENQFGVKIPGVRFRGNETDLPDGVYIIMINEIPLVSGTIELDKRFCPGPREALFSLRVMGKEASNPLTGGGGFWIRQDDWQKLETAGLELWDVIEYVIRHLEAVVQRNLIEFLGHQEIVNIFEIEASNMLEEMRAWPKKLSALTTVCRGLVAEGVPIKPFPEIYNEFNRLYSERTNLQEIVEGIRSLP